MGSVAASIDLDDPGNWLPAPEYSPPEEPRAKGRPSAPKELAEMLAKLLGAATTVIAVGLGCEALAMEPGEAQSIAAPAGRMLSRSASGKKLAKKALGANDAIDLSIALACYGIRVYGPLQAQAKAKIEARKQRESTGQAASVPGHGERSGGSGPALGAIPFNGGTVPVGEWYGEPAS